LTSTDFPTLIKSLYSLQRDGIKLGLDHTIQLLNTIDNPHKNLRLIHVAGTNGKGSTCSIIFNILRESGQKVGLYTSPHLLRFNERIRVNGIPIKDEEIMIFMNKVEHDIKRIQATFFETTTAMALDHFRKKNVDTAIIETGLGGSLDSTNVISPDLSVITPISLDHKEILGNNIIKIATQKAGIIKPRIPIISSEQQQKVEEILQNKAMKSNSEIQIIYNSMIKDFVHNENGCNFTFEGQSYQLPFIGFHQAYNAALAIKSVQKYDSSIKPSELQIGLRTVRWPGRLEQVGEYIYYDVAHNQSGIYHVIKTIKSIYSDRKLIVLFCLKNDKDFDLIIQSFQNNIDTIYVTKDKNGLLTDHYQLSEKLKNAGYENKPVKSVSEGVSIMKQSINQEGVGLIFGSHYIAEEVYNQFGISFDSGQI